MGSFRFSVLCYFLTPAHIIQSNEATRSRTTHRNYSLDAHALGPKPSSDLNFTSIVKRTVATNVTHSSDEIIDR